MGSVRRLNASIFCVCVQSVTAYALHAYASKLAQEYAWTSVAPLENSGSGSPYTSTSGSPYNSESKHLLDDTSAAADKRESTFSFHHLQQHLPNSHLPTHLHRHQKTDSNGSNGSDGSVHNPNRDSASSFAFVGYENTPPGLHHDVNVNFDIDLEAHPHGRMSSEETLLNNPHPHNDHRSTKEAESDVGDSGEDGDGDGERMPFESLSIPRKERDLNRMSSYESYEDPYYRSS